MTIIVTKLRLEYKLEIIESFRAFENEVNSITSEIKQSPEVSIEIISLPEKNGENWYDYLKVWFPAAKL